MGTACCVCVVSCFAVICVVSLFCALCHVLVGCWFGFVWVCARVRCVVLFYFVCGLGVLGFLFIVGWWCFVCLVVAASLVLVGYIVFCVVFVLLLVYSCLFACFSCFFVLGVAGVVVLLFYGVVCLCLFYLLVVVLG